jgi:hypothetical protein
MNDKKVNLTENLENLHKIADWFDQQTQIDVEEGLKKIKEAAILIKESKTRLREIENEFAEIQADISTEIDQSEAIEEIQAVVISTEDEKESPDEDIPF